MHPPKHFASLLVAVHVLTGALSAQAKDQPVALEQCPGPVQATIRHYSAQASLETIGLDLDQAAPIYEAKFTLKSGERYEVHITADGKVLRFEKKKKKP
jgi:hypothetical protein